MDFRDLVTDYEMFAKQGIRLNQSYLEMINTYNELSLAPDLLVKVQDSIFKAIESMQRDQKLLVGKLSSLIGSMEPVLNSLNEQTDIKQLEDIRHDIPIMIDFISSIDLVDLRQIFVDLILVR
jgi:hypothetical protein